MFESSALFVFGFTDMIKAELYLMKVNVLAIAQTTGSITGTVTDPQGTVVSGATVSVSNGKNPAKTNGDGLFVVPTIVSGAYTVAIKSTGFKKPIGGEVLVCVGPTCGIDVRLEVGRATETVTVVGGRTRNGTRSGADNITLDGFNAMDKPVKKTNAF
jgi:Carboxypeptidase regulatory-like domain